VDALLDAGVNHIDVLDNLVRGRVGNLADALETGRVELVRGTIQDRDLVHDLTKGKDLVFHQAAIRITQCAEEPRLALEVLVDGTFNILEAAAEHGWAGSLPRPAPRSTEWQRSFPRGKATTTPITTHSMGQPSPSMRAWPGVSTP
jgi:hypothetical protein